MEVLLVWLSTIIASFGMEVVYELKLFKDIADSGFKIDIGKLNKNNQMDSESNKKFKIATISNLIPIYNILMTLFKVATYNRDYIFRSLDASGVIVPFNNEEYNKYQSKKTGLNAFLISIKEEDEYKNAYRLTAFEGNDQGDIYFTLDNEHTKIDVVRLTGIAKNFSIERQNTEVIKHLLIHQAIGDDKFIEYDIDKFNNKYSMESEPIKEAIESEDIKKELEEFKQFLLNNEQKEKSHQYTKKK